MAKGTTHKLILILKQLAYTGAAVAVQQVAKATGLTVATTYRLLQTLVDEGVAAYDPVNRQYGLGSESVSIAAAILGSDSLIGRVRPIVRRLADELTETCSFSMLDQATLTHVVVVVERGPHALGYEYDAGRRDPLHAGASGKVMLAFLPDKDIDDYLKRGNLKKLTPQTVTEPAKLRAQIKAIRNCGYGLSRAERIPGQGRGVAVPVFSVKGRIAGSLVITTPVFRFKQGRLPKIVQMMQKAAAELAGFTDAALASTKVAQVAGARR